jgi:CheY-like chemotaxis protein
MVQGATSEGHPAQAGPFILLVDDDAELGELLGKFLGQRGFRLEVALDGRRGLARALAGDHDLVLLDVMMPGLDGFDPPRDLLRRAAGARRVLTTHRHGNRARRRPMLVLSRKVGETIVIDGGIRLTVVAIHGRQTRIGIEAPKSWPTRVRPAAVSRSASVAQATPKSATSLSSGGRIRARLFGNGPRV